MGRIICPDPVKLIFSIISAEDILFSEAKDLLINHFGEMDLESDFQPFDYTRYYQKEMGDGLKQKLLSFETLISPIQLSQIKSESNKWEFLCSKITNNPDTLSIDKRKINFDPGYLTLHKFILASTKDGPARIYLDDGIYAEITLMFICKSFRPLEWTYQNYQSNLYITFLNRVRDKYKKQIKEYRLNKLHHRK